MIEHNFNIKIKVKFRLSWIKRLIDNEVIFNKLRERKERQRDKVTQRHRERVRQTHREEERKRGRKTERQRETDRQRSNFQ
jgi:hypothetical protein